MDNSNNKRESLLITPVQFHYYISHSLTSLFVVVLLFSTLLVHKRMNCHTCLSPGTSVTGVPSALIQSISGRGLPVAAQSTTVPVVFEKSMRLVGSFKKTGPDKPLPPFIPSARLPPVVVVVQEEEEKEEENNVNQSVKESCIYKRESASNNKGGKYAVHSTWNTRVDRSSTYYNECRKQFDQLMNGVHPLGNEI